MQVKGTEWKFGLIFKSKEKKKEKICSSAESIFDSRKKGFVKFFA